MASIARKLRRTAATKSVSQARCGLCGATRRLTRTQCCGNWICDDEGEYQLFSYARNSCFRNHHRYTVCGQHYAEEHDGRWQECAQCRSATEAELYADAATNGYNFERLANPPPFEPKRCAECDAVIRLAQGGYSVREGRYCCHVCTGKRFPMLERSR